MTTTDLFLIVLLAAGIVHAQVNFGEESSAAASVEAVDAAAPESTNDDGDKEVDLRHHFYRPYTYGYKGYTSYSNYYPSYSNYNYRPAQSNYGYNTGYYNQQQYYRPSVQAVPAHQQYYQPYNAYPAQSYNYPSTSSQNYEKYEKYTYEKYGQTYGTYGGLGLFTGLGWREGEKQEAAAETATAEAQAPAAGPADAVKFSE